MGMITCSIGKEKCLITHHSISIKFMRYSIMNLDIVDRFLERHHIYDEDERQDFYLEFLIADRDYNEEEDGFYSTYILKKLTTALQRFNRRKEKRPELINIDDIDITVDIISAVISKIHVDMFIEKYNNDYIGYHYYNNKQYSLRNHEIFIGYVIFRKTAVDLAKEFNITRARVNQIINHEMRSIRNNKRRKGWLLW